MCIRNCLRGLLVLWLTGSAVMSRVWSDEEIKLISPEQSMHIPYLSPIPKIDGRMSPEEWDYANKITGFQSIKSWTGLTGICEPQADVYVGHNFEHLFICYQSRQKALVANAVTRDSKEVIFDDTIELLIAPGTGNEVKRDRFPSYYLVANKLGTMFDVKQFENLNELHMDWDGPWIFEQSQEGELWTVEIAVPLASFGEHLPQEGDIWRMNFTRTFYKILWVCWRAGNLNSPANGGEVVFSRNVPAIRIASIQPLLEGKAGLSLDIVSAEGFAEPLEVKLRIYSQKGDIISESKEIPSLKAGERKGISFGGVHSLDALNRIIMTVTNKKSNERYFLFDRIMADKPAELPVLTEAPQTAGFYLYPRFLPTKERLSVNFNFLAREDKAEVKAVSLRIYPEGQEKDTILKGKIDSFEKFGGVWRENTHSLSEGKYWVEATLLDKKGKEIDREKEWFVKELPEWFTNPRGMGDYLLSMFTPLYTTGNIVHCWGREYAFTDEGLPDNILSQKRPFLNAPAKILIESRDQKIPLEIKQPFSFLTRSEIKVTAGSELEAGGLKTRLNWEIEQDGLMKLTLRYGPVSNPVNIEKMSLVLPFNDKYCRLYLAMGDNQYCVKSGPTPPGEGVIFESKKEIYNTNRKGNFCSSLQLGDMDICFIIAGESDEGWIGDDDKSCLELERDKNVLTARLNLVNRQVVIDKERKIVLLFHAGPVKPLPEGWRGISEYASPSEVPLKLGFYPPYKFHHYYNVRPNNPETAKNEAWAKPGGPYDVFHAYNFFRQTSINEEYSPGMRGEWVQNKSVWDMPDDKSRYDPDNERFAKCIEVQVVPSYVDFETFNFEKAVESIDIAGVYDDVGVLPLVFDPELGIGYTREEDGWPQPDNLWLLYRERWKRAAYVLDKYRLPNYLGPYGWAHPIIASFTNFMMVGEGRYVERQDWDLVDQFNPTIEDFNLFCSGRQYGAVCFAGMGTNLESPPKHKRRVTRTLIMLCYLHDILIGHAGYRDTNECIKWERLRLSFRPWEKDVEFHGFWRNKEMLIVDGEGVLGSVYTAKDRVLFVVGNLSKQEVKTKLRPDWAKLRLVPTEATDMESGNKIAIGIKEPGHGMAKGLEFIMPPRDLKMILVRGE